jgi:SAM-dependent methyltransferase
MEESALHFDKNSQIYNNARHGYPKEIYEIISNYKIFGANSAILEIGAGNGIASQEIYNKWAPKLTLIEPGYSLCELSRQKFNENKNIIIKNTTFEEYQSGLLFDAIFSATAFHWIDAAIKYKKSYEILKDDGLLVLYWNNYGVENSDLEREIQEIYVKYGKGTGDGKSVYEKQMEKIDGRKKEIEKSRHFKIIEHKIMKNVTRCAGENYMTLLKTFSDHSRMEKEFFEEIREIIMKDGSEIDVRIITNLEIAGKV